MVNTDELMGIDRMIDEIVRSKEGKYFTIVEVSPINFSYKTPEDQELIIANFASYLKVAPIRFRVKVLSRPVNVNNYISALRKDFAKDDTQNATLDKYREDYINLVHNIGNHEGIERQFLLVLEFCNSEMSQANSEEEIVYQLRRARDIAAKYLSACGNEVIEHENETDFVLETLYKIANRDKPIDTLWDRIEKIKPEVVKYYHNDEEELADLIGYFNNICAPDTVEYYRDYCRVNNTYYTFLLLPSSAYQTYVPASWLSFLYNYDEGIDIDVWARQEPTGAIKSKMKTTLRFASARFSDKANKGYGGVADDTLKETGDTIESGVYLKDCLNNGENFYYFNTLITISAGNAMTLQKKQIEIRERLNSLGYTSMEVPYMVDKALFSYMPTNQLHPKFFNITKRNTTTWGVASMYPFSSFELSDDKGILFGLSRDNGSMVVADNFNQQKYSNANMVLLGTSGAGKSFALQTMCMRYRLRGIPVYAILPEKGEEFERAATALGGQYINLSFDSPDRINIMDIRPPIDFFEADNSAALFSRRNKKIFLNEKIKNLTTFFSLIMPSLGPKEEQLLDDAIVYTYKLKGITNNNDSLIDHYENAIKDGKSYSRPVLKEMPILEDLYNVLDKNPETQSIALLLKKYVKGSASSFNGQTNVNLDNKYIIMDITDLDDDYKPVGMFLAIEYIWDKVCEDKTKKKVVAIDEVWKLIFSNEAAASFVQKIYKTIRGYGGAAISATQNIADFFALKDGIYGESIIGNSRIKLILRLEPKEADKVKNVLDLSDSEVRTIKTFRRGEMLVKSNSNTFSLQYVASPYETLLVTTDRELLERMASGELITDEHLAA